ncbi:MAG TPA: ketopantoate reductase family protein [Candidatus Choladousia intestinigallinarum]|nr:ketopantoate reductase family protein [Candidatus Choladousia intestinigallinarum]
MICNVGIIGLGALGILFASQFQEKTEKNKVYILADETRLQRYRREGIYCNGRLCDFQYVSPSKAPEMDLLIFATKYQGLSQAAEAAKPVCGPKTIVMSFLNGISSEEFIREHLHPQRLLYCTVQGMDATRQENHLTYENPGSVVFGEKDGSITPAIREVEEFFSRTGIKFSISQDILHQLWSKWMLNVGVNQSCAVFAESYGGVQKEGRARQAMIEAMREARKAAAAEGIFLSEKEMEDWVALVDTLSPQGEPSMRQDTKAGRETEVDLFAGLVCRLGKKHGIPTPENDFFYQSLKEN